MLDLRARIVMARHAAARSEWEKADAYLTGIGPTQPAYQLFLGMRVRLLAEAVRGRLKTAKAPKRCAPQRAVVMFFTDCGATAPARRAVRAAIAFAPSIVRLLKPPLWASFRARLSVMAGAALLKRGATSDLLQNRLWPFGR